LDRRTHNHQQGNEDNHWKDEANVGFAHLFVLFYLKASYRILHFLAGFK